METLIGFGHEVWFLHILKEKGDPAAMRAHWGEHYISLPYTMRKPGVLSRLWGRLRRFVEPESSYVYSVDAWYDPSLDRELGRLLREHAFDAVIVEYVFLSRALICFGKNVLKILDTHGVFTDRHLAFLRRNQKPEWYSTTRKEEMKGLNRADVVLAIQSQDRHFLEGMTSSRVITVGHPVIVEKPERRKPDRFNLLYFGSSNASNYQSVMFFINEVLPLLRRRLPRLKLVIAGKISERIEDDEAILKLGEIDDIRNVYEAADVIINPIQFGTGLKIKSIEAMGQGRPLVTTSIGAEGMEQGRGSAYLVADDVAEFVTEIEKLFSDENYYNSIASQAVDFARRWNHETTRELSALLRG
jgi:glycosyltransferase involved in cell wall biosynthesis